MVLRYFDSAHGYCLEDVDYFEAFDYYFEAFVRPALEDVDYFAAVTRFGFGAFALYLVALFHPVVEAFGLRLSSASSWPDFENSLVGSSPGFAVFVPAANVVHSAPDCVVYFLFDYY